MKFNLSDVPERFLRRITVNLNGCWIFKGDPSSNGYQRLWIYGRRFMAHRYMYELANKNKDIRKLQLDHLCEERACCNPEHLDPVTPKVNSRRKYRRRKRVPGELQREGNSQK